MEIHLSYMIPLDFEMRQAFFRRKYVNFFTGLIFNNKKQKNFLSFSNTFEF